MSEIRVSIIVPVYNAANYLSECLESLLVQSIDCFELLLVDDGSKDESGKLCDEYASKDPRIRVVHKENGGVSSARNLGLDIARGEWVCFVDSDDLVDRAFLKNLFLYDNSDWIIGGATCFGASQDCIRQEKVSVLDISEIGQFTLELKNMRCVFYYSCGKLFKRSLIQEYSIRFNPNMIACEDTCFNMEYICACKQIAVTDRADYKYRIASGPKRLMNFQIYNYHLALFDTSYNNLLKRIKVPVHLLYKDIHQALLGQFISHQFYTTRTNFMTDSKQIIAHRKSELLVLRDDFLLKGMLCNFCFKYPTLGFFIFHLFHKLKH